MPVYEFVCNACGTPISVFVRSMSSPVEGKCANCGSTDLRRLISPFAVIKGAGDSGLGGMDPEMQSMLSQMGGGMGGMGMDDFGGMGGLGGMDDFGDDDL